MVEQVCVQRRMKDTRSGIQFKHVGKNALAVSCVVRKNPSGGGPSSYDLIGHDD